MLLRLRLLAALPVALWLGFSAGCNSDPRPEKTGGMPGVIPDYPTAMSGTENFDGDKIGVEITLGVPSDYRPGKESVHGGASGSHSGGHRSGGRHSGGGMGAAGGYAGSAGGGEGPALEGTSGNDSPRPLMGSTLPPAQLKLHLWNRSTTEAVACEVVDFNSTLGNFAVFPSSYKIEAGQAVSSETMTSRLGVEGSEIPVTVALRVHGQVERKVILLHTVPLPDKPADIPSAK